MLKQVNMPRSLRFLLALMLGLGLLTLAADVAVHRTLWLWSERDLRLRSELAIHGARRTLVSAWRRRALNELRATLTDIARDKRIIAAAACGFPDRLLVHSDEYPLQITCQSFAQQVFSQTGVQPVHSIVSLAEGRLYLSALPLVEERELIGSATNWVRGQRAYRLGRGPHRLY